MNLHVDHANEHAVPERMASVFNDGNDICPMSSHVDEISARSMREFNRENYASGPNNVRDMRDRGSAGCTEIEHLGTWTHAITSLVRKGLKDGIFGSRTRFHQDLLIYLRRAWI